MRLVEADREIQSLRECITTLKSGTRTVGKPDCGSVDFSKHTQHLNEFHDVFVTHKLSVIPSEFNLSNNWITTTSADPSQAACSNLNGRSSSTDSMLTESHTTGCDAPLTESNCNSNVIPTSVASCKSLSPDTLTDRFQGVPLSSCGLSKDCRSSLPITAHGSGNDNSKQSSISHFRCAHGCLHTVDCLNFMQIHSVTATNKRVCRHACLHSKTCGFHQTVCAPNLSQARCSFGTDKPSAPPSLSVDALNLTCSKPLPVLSGEYYDSQSLRIVPTCSNSRSDCCCSVGTGKLDGKASSARRECLDDRTELSGSFLTEVETNEPRPN
ncbi:hypothetical protein PHET_11593 [Paragonimus heterotremus]|uniref:Uncharacterized protein n=1 Tax=Paragonimus heterotremus TaxID=100268 RepID=A0A8J4STF8_9TREM|nr:hypothetical protein PHET_11593 [Paragonimus heterotremus]